MNDKEKQEYLERYQDAKKNGEHFFPDSLFKDAVISLVIFLVLIALASLLGAPLEARADPADSSYTPRPEWYFLFLFQLLKYFPGNLEVVGVVVIPTIAIILLLVLPLIDRSPRRHPRSRPVVIGITFLSLAGIVFLSIQSVREAPPPAEAALGGDQTAVLYTKNCAGCHGASVAVGPGTNLHEVIAQGRHEGMPAWSADLTTDQIDSLVGFILSPQGSNLFTQYCSECHQASELVEGDPLTLKNVLEQGSANPAHADLDANWSEALNQEERTSLLNFLIAPDGQRLFTIYCASCHGYSVAFSGEEDDLRRIISQGGMHLDMPPWQEQLSDAELDSLAGYVVDPAANTGGAQLFETHCARCHGEKTPQAADISQARETIASGGPHQTMPVWGSLLTEEQLNALVDYTYAASKGTSTEAGQRLFAANCAACHGGFGEGGVNPSRPGDIIAPISTSEYLKTRDDVTLRSIISQGQPNFGMSPFGSANGGPLEESDIDAIVAYMRSWEANPPVELAPEIPAPEPSMNASEVFTNLCIQCHGPTGEGGIGPSLSDPKFQDSVTDQDIFDIIDKGHDDTAMIAWGAILTTEQKQGLVDYIRALRPTSTTGPTPTASPALNPSPTPGSGALSFSNDVLPIFEAKCNMCHGTMGGWSGASYQDVMTSGDHSPVVVPGDAEGSLLMQKLLGTQASGTIMPPGGKLLEAEIQIIQEWIAAGAPE